MASRPPQKSTQTSAQQCMEGPLEPPLVRPSNRTIRRRQVAGQRGFILALGLLMIAALALIGTMALSTTTFQKELADNARAGQQMYFLANAALSRGLEHMMVEFPTRYNTPVDQGATAPPTYPAPYMYGAYFTDTAAPLYSTPPLIAPEACLPPLKPRSCVCGAPNNAWDKACVDYTLYLYFVNEGQAPPQFGIEEFKTFYWKLTATNNSFGGSGSQASVYAAGVYRVAQ